MPLVSLCLFFKFSLYDRRLIKVKLSHISEHNSGEKKYKKSLVTIWCYYDLKIPLLQFWIHIVTRYNYCSQTTPSCSALTSERGYGPVWHPHEMFM